MRGAGLKITPVGLLVMLLPSMAAAQVTTTLKPRWSGAPILSQSAVRKLEAKCLEWGYDGQKNESVCVKYASPQTTAGGGCGGSADCGANNRPGYRWEYKPDEALVLQKPGDFRSTRDVVSPTSKDLSKKNAFSKESIERSR